MQLVEQFMQEFFKDRADLRLSWLSHSTPFRQKFFAEEHSMNTDRSLMLKDGAEELLSAAIYADSAEVITRESRSENIQSTRFRYWLRRRGVSWLIERTDWECFSCRDTERRASCQICGGTGWRSNGHVA